jgi:F0F1-type ATP synthase membrane subunit a
VTGVQTCALPICLVAIVFWLLRKYKISEEEKEKKELIENIASWFERNPNRNIHVTPKEEMKK